MINLAGKLLQASVFLLILLWVYAAVSKIADFRNFQMQMKLQPFGQGAAVYIAYLLPCIELIVTALLTNEKTRGAGLYSSLLLLAIFTGYIGLVVFHFFSSVPCTCGGILQKMGWVPHLLFNLIFLTINAVAVIIHQRKEDRKQ